MRSAIDPERNIVPLGALALFLATVEALIPKPVPFFRIGLSNLPLLLGLPVVTGPEYLLLVGVKILAQGLMGGTLFSPMIVLSAGGSAGSALAMLLLYRSLYPLIGAVGISLIGALVSNLIQIFLASILFLGSSAWFLMPPILAVGFVTSALLGWWAQGFWNTSLWIEKRRRR